MLYQTLCSRAFRRFREREMELKETSPGFVHNLSQSTYPPNSTCSMKSYTSLLVIALFASSLAYTPTSKSRKAFLQTAITSALLAPQAVLISPPTAQAISPFIDDYEVVDGQQATGGKIDLNSAYVTDYKQFRGLYPTIAGKLASHGPYKVR